jgi:hypothetical protein
MRRLFGLIFLASVAVACTKVPGDGGNSHIKGQVMLEYRLVLTNPATAQNTVPAADEDVYIVYGDHTSPDDRVQTNFDGEFEFRNLRTGDYTVYVYSNDTTGSGDFASNRMPIIIETEVVDRKQVVELEPITIYEKAN